MVKSMASVKVTITVPEEQLAAIQERVAAKQSASISGFIQESISKLLDGRRALQEMVDETLLKTGGPATARERALARRILDGKKGHGRASRRSKAA
jgi:Arc/MetJ-type ribon-helix-helix transcriptional regulator